MRPTMNELVKMLDERISEIEASKMPDKSEDVAAYLRWQGELSDQAARLGAIAADAEGSK